ncbi:LytTR family transcriptional regulator DNA-binding domain-containing protein [Paenibacillus spongiae]|uniref:LytTR family transcriptional regulator DNA-binding domain-containing protein n=1 Tax=Paenibacillus spongiae TaxID=2909671 RepID=A0ABY5SBA1_9BACL|nr:LytTR family transcriptional regulator DNA-binding domain-containing protein [Paenibacillus spongiae]UVI31202.1 LytTR family transcriptional regulator DNA-binding domain-containing protein [Paenibacillus spongiae]
MDFIIRLKSGKEFRFGLNYGTLEDVEKKLNKSKFIRIDKVLINVDEIEYIEPH